MMRRVRAALLPAVLAGSCALVAVSVVARAAPAAPTPLAAAASGGRHAVRAGHRSKCGRPASRRHAHAHRCRARRHCSKRRAPPPAALTPAPASPLGAVLESQAPIPLSAATLPASTPLPTPQPSEEASPVQPPSVAHIQVSAVEYGFSLSRTIVPAGKVVFEFVNNGQDEHNLNIAAPEGPPTGAFADTPPKGVSDLTLELHPGTFRLFCSLPQHESKGMKATLVVE